MPKATVVGSVVRRISFIPTSLVSPRPEVESQPMNEPARIATPVEHLQAHLAGDMDRVNALIRTRMASRHAPRIPEVTAHLVEAGGKRLRPLLTVLTARSLGADPALALDPACAVEMIHTYSLVHDDLPSMDDDDMRRGRPTVHRAFDGVRAMVAGAALLPLAMRVLVDEAAALGLTEAEGAALVVELARAAGAEGMVGGQFADLSSEHREVTAAELESIHRRKTGALLTCALRLGARAGRGSDELLHALTRYGGALGLAFQIADDLLDVEGDAAALGKTAGRDAALHKASYPALYGVQGARERAAQKAAEARESVAAMNLPELEALATYVVERRR